MHHSHHWRRRRTYYGAPVDQAGRAIALFACAVLFILAVGLLVAL